MGKRSYHIENHPVRFPAIKLTHENYGHGQGKSWPFVWLHGTADEHHYNVKPGWKILGTCLPPFASKCPNNTRAVVAEEIDTWAFYWWHFSVGEVVIHPQALGLSD